MAVMSDGESYEKILIFGGIAKQERVSRLSNQLLVIEIRQIL